MLKKEIDKILSCLLLLFFSLLLASSAGASEITIKDNLGRRVKIPEKVERIVCLQPELLRILAALNSQHRVVAVDRFPSRYDHLMRIIFPDVEKLPVVSITGEDVNIERIIQLEPDLVLVSPSELNLATQLTRKLKCPVVSLSSMGSIERLLEEIEILAAITGNQKRGKEIVRFMKEEINMVRQKSASYGRKPRVYLSFWGSILRSPFSYDPVDLAGGINLAGQFKSVHQGSDTVVLKLETLLGMDPDIILVQGNYPPEERQVSVESVLTDARLQSLKAVKERKVHYTFGFWYWWDPALVLVESHYLAELFQKGQVEGNSIISLGERIFYFFYGRPGLFEKLCAKIKAYEWFQN
ncbi:MAG: ABC transporter substrate-binding protein [Candidatus Saccharicenans sp.]|nr:ABC transporter substrate-binding protein [Candidatus Saccharicenans sp.]